MVSDKEKDLLEAMQASALQVSGFANILLNARISDQQELEIVTALDETVDALSAGVEKLAGARQGTPILVEVSTDNEERP